MLQQRSGSSIRPILAEAGFRLLALEPSLPLSPTLIARLLTAGIKVKADASPDVVLADERTQHLVMECKAKMFGAVPSSEGNDSNQRQARAFLLQTPEVLSSALGGLTVGGSHLAYLTRHDEKHDQNEGVRALALELKSAKLPVVECCVFRLVEHEGGIAVFVPKRGEKWPDRIRTTCKPAKGQKAVTIVPRDESGNDLRPLYFMPWMPDSESNVSEYNRRAFGNRILGASVTRIGRAAVGEDATLKIDELLDEVTLGVFARWRNRETTKAVRAAARKLLKEHLKLAHAMINEPDDLEVTIVVKLPDEKTKAAIIKAFRDTITTEWDKPEPPSLFDDLANRTNPGATD
jgi:hypothetical protein